VQPGPGSAIMESCSLQMASSAIKMWAWFAWQKGGFAGNLLWRAEKLWRTCMSVTLVSPASYKQRCTRFWPKRTQVCASLRSTILVSYLHKFVYTVIINLTWEIQRSHRESGNIIIHQILYRISFSLSHFSSVKSSIHFNKTHKIKLKHK
jgi:hypothetical protein